MDGRLGEDQRDADRQRQREQDGLRGPMVRCYRVSTPGATVTTTFCSLLAFP